ncbi:TIGR01777 family oxidoreductase [Neolewinella lacunae]|uniref:TIGR01777 family protein n=1 Tax=Neolewinella lacunae TaxID=1517758 RepID=A0A923PK69_9BACT|nr:TIGR01777 family oxidoreductase [Neolewinella lacunae]MBC6994859.1 TIGR01777 family protein [Neolewinella lacunae]MDN3636779.1 TIGR01777 family oxidoreductase [Neolewinella lacunae]
MATILIGGGTGFIGMHLSRRLRSLGHQVRHLSRTADRSADFPAYHWDVAAGKIDDAAFDGVEYVINLAGAGIADAHWTARRKQLIIDSRTQSTALLASTLGRLQLRPRLYLSASAIGFYGDRGNDLMRESDSPGTGFLSKSCVLWEESTEAIRGLGIPLFINRTGIVLHPEGGALQKMLLPLHARVSTYFGDGAQYYSWIHLDDIVNIYAYAIEHGLTGVYNGTAPEPVTNKVLAAALGPAAGKSALLLPAPSFALKLAMGEMSHTVLDSCRCSAAKVQAAGFEFAHPELEGALRDLLADR